MKNRFSYYTGVHLVNAEHFVDDESTIHEQSTKIKLTSTKRRFISIVQKIYLDYLWSQRNYSVWD